MINYKWLIRSFEEIIGWPYASPGSNGPDGIDCSGAFVRAFRAQGADIYHGSNRIARAHCHGMRPITSEAELMPGMAVFKLRQDDQESAAYKPGGQHYTPALTGNFYHIGLVCGISPLRIIHATPPSARVDTSLGGWSWAGYLSDVDYGAGSAALPVFATVATSGGGLNMRGTPGGEYMQKVPNGTELIVMQHVDGWVKTAYNGFCGWVSDDYLRMDEGGVGTPTGNSATISADAISSLRACLYMALELLDRCTEVG